MVSIHLNVSIFVKQFSIQTNDSIDLLAFQIDALHLFEAVLASHPYWIAHL